MIVRILSAGKSFKGLGTYLTHDAAAETTERVGWTHTLNCANDHVPSAIDEMLWTSRNAELLKQEAGIRAGGRATENSVKHLSLNWSPEDNPTREHMIETTEDFLRHMKWQDHQALLVAHEDKEYSHVHVMLNMVHPETGLKLDDNFERRRAQEWALEYEKENERIYCEQRLKNVDEREDAPTRPTWMTFKEKEIEFQRDENKRRELEINFLNNAENQKNPENPNALEWKMLKDLQRREREDFFADGKSAFREIRSEIFQEVREEFRPQWAEYYAAAKNGADPDMLKEMKAGLVKEQRTILEDRRDEAYDALRVSRDGIYRDLLDGQAEMRHALHARQDAGLTSLDLLDCFEAGAYGKTADAVQAFREAGREVTAERGEREWNENASEEFTAQRSEPNGNMRSESAMATNVSISLGFGLINIAGSIADSLMGSNPAPRPPKPVEPDYPKRNLFELSAEHAREQAEREARLLDPRCFHEEEERSRE